MGQAVHQNAKKLVVVVTNNETVITALYCCLTVESGYFVSVGLIRLEIARLVSLDPEELKRWFENVFNFY